MGIKCFMLHETGRFRIGMRRFVFSSNMDCAKSPSKCHEAFTPALAVRQVAKDAEGHWQTIPDTYWPHSDPRWPTKCASCDYLFTDNDEWQVYAVEELVTDDNRLFCRPGFIHTLGLTPAPAGAMWYANWVPDCWKGPDGHGLAVVCPGGAGHVWHIDGQASNCTNPNDVGPFDVAHRCWVRHGTPPNITVDKHGRTCRAGAGSIKVPGYHGFLRNGEFTDNV